MTSSTNKLEVNNLCLSYEGKLTLDHLSFTVSEGEFVAILGPSGCGKSTLLNILSGILKPDSGEFLVDGTPIEGISPHFAYMPQEDLLLPWYNILDNVTLYAKIHGNLAEAKNTALKEFSVFGLEGYETAWPRELSGGMRQRAAFLRTALCSADILLLDEPFGALDVITRNDMQDWLLNLRKEIGKTTLLVTHDIEEALYLADRILILSANGAKIIKQIQLSTEEKSREWLYRISDIKTEIFNLLRG